MSTNWGQLIGQLVGGAGGFMVGGPAGAGIGASLGGSLGNSIGGSGSSQGAGSSPMGGVTGSDMFGGGGMSNALMGAGIGSLLGGLGGQKQLPQYDPKDFVLGHKMNPGYIVPGVQGGAQANQYLSTLQNQNQSGMANKLGQAGMGLDLMKLLSNPNSTFGQAGLSGNWLGNTASAGLPGYAATGLPEVSSAAQFIY